MTNTYNKLNVAARLACALVLALACNVCAEQETARHASELKQLDAYTLAGEKHLLHGYSAFSDENSINAVIEIPTGTNAKWEVDKSSGQLQWEFKKGKPRVVKYLSYPGNYGMVPQTLLSEADGGDGDPLDVIVLGPAVPRGSVVAVTPIGVLKMLDKGEQDDKIIAVMKGTPFKKIGSLKELQKKFPGTVKILKTWFANYKGQKKIEILGTDSVDAARKIIKTAAKGYQQAQR
ncbi:MAG: inorganic diphosphatase [Desulfuromonadales bacterium]|nr:inorganic diphosphatase [Desulfuromonadales bacterium]